MPICAQCGGLISYGVDAGSGIIVCYPCAGLIRCMDCGTWTRRIETPNGLCRTCRDQDERDAWIADVCLVIDRLADDHGWQVEWQWVVTRSRYAVLSRPAPTVGTDLREYLVVRVSDRPARFRGQDLSISRGGREATIDELATILAQQPCNIGTVE